MAVTLTSLTVPGTAAPWNFQGATNAGPTGTLVPFQSGFNDGSSTKSAPVANAAFRYGQQHGNAGETSGVTMAVSPFQYIIIAWTGPNNPADRVAASPQGSVTTGLSPLPAPGTDAQGYSLPTNVINPIAAAGVCDVTGLAGANGFNASGTCSTSTTQATFVTGTAPDTRMNGGTIWLLNRAGGTAASFIVSHATSGGFSTTATMGTQTAAYFYQSARTSVKGLVGAFLDNTGAILSTWDWAGCGGGSATAAVSGLAGGGNPAPVGVTGSGYIGLIAPTGAAVLTMGINDTVLSANGGSYGIAVIQMDTDYLSLVGADGTTGYGGSQNFFKQFPVGQAAPSAVRDYATFSSGSTTTNIKQTVFGSSYWMPQTTAGVSLIATYVGQLFPRGAQNWGGNPAGTFGQNFPY